MTLNANGGLGGTPTTSGRKEFTICTIDLREQESCRTPSLTVDSSKGELEAPEPLGASQGTFDQMIHVAWRAVPNAIEYLIYRKSSNDLTTAERYSTVLASNSGQASYKDNGVVNDKFYYYWIKAKSKADATQPSEREKAEVEAKFSPFSREISGYASNPLTGEWEGTTMELEQIRVGCPSSGTWKATIRWLNRKPKVKWSDSFLGSPNILNEYDMSAMGSNDSKDVDWAGQFGAMVSNQRSVSFKFLPFSAPPTVSGSFSTLGLCDNKGSRWIIKGTRVKGPPPPS